ncbi:hypothetical protein HMPREF9151_02365 [Hoylesella saccharolytica F0055]|uniref:Uncharacterized protein n=1 Tax=Hoylesella saccharolytica F0055 TaxID=1127699 RepID=L1N0F8_9BACT|nr:hypothetical protein HMPREF9151_02365 [Hoylesella saccharolytica F0055]
MTHSLTFSDSEIKQKKRPEQIFSSPTLSIFRRFTGCKPKINRYLSARKVSRKGIAQRAPTSPNLLK